MPREETQFKKGNKAGGHGGRPKEHPLKGKVAFALWDAMAKLSQMKEADAQKKIDGNPTVAEAAAWKYIQEYPSEFIDRFCGRIPNKQEHTGPEGDVIEMTLNIRT